MNRLLKPLKKLPKTLDQIKNDSQYNILNLSTYIIRMKAVLV